MAYKRAKDSLKIKFVIFTCSSVKFAAAHSRQHKSVQWFAAFDCYNFWNSTSSKNPIKSEKAAVYRTNGVSGIYSGKILFFPRFFQKSGRGLGQSPIKIPRASFGQHPINPRNASSAKFRAALLQPWLRLFTEVKLNPKSNKIRKSRRIPHERSEWDIRR